MRNWIPAFVVVFIAIVGIGSAVTYEAPEFEIFLFNQELDQDLFNAKSQTGIMIEETLNQLQPAMSELINEGQIYDQSADLTETFNIFNEVKDQLGIYVEDVSPEIDKLIQQLNFTKIEKRVSSLSQDHQPLAENLIESQQERLELLLVIHAQLEELDEKLVSFQEMFYSMERPSQTLAYFQSLVYLLEEIDANHKDYVMATENYQQAKTEYFLILINMGSRDYLFGA